MKFDVKKTEILRRAEELLIAFPQEKPSLNYILKELNIPKGKFYYYFHSKDDFYYQVLVSDAVATRKIYEKIKQEMTSYNAYLHIIEVVFGNMLALEKNEILLYLRNQFSDFSSGDDYHEIMNDEDLSTFKIIIQDGIESGEFSPKIDIDLIHQLIVNNAVGLLFIWSLDKGNLDLVKHIKDTSSVLLNEFLISSK